MELLLKPIDYGNWAEAQAMLQRSFTSAMSDCVETRPESPTLDGVLEKPGVAPLAAYQSGQMVGGAVVSFGTDGHHILELLWIDSEHIDRGIGHLLWDMIERSYPLAKSWKTMTAACLPRSIYFYVNKCGFHIVKVESVSGTHGQRMYILQKKIDPS